MKLISKLLIVLSILLFMNCKNDTEKTSAKITPANLEYHFENHTDHNFLKCDYPNKQLLEEALFSFEDDIMKQLDTSENRLVSAYPRFIHGFIRKSIYMDSIVSPHSKDIAEALKQEPNLWVKQDGKLVLDYQQPLFKCIGENIEYKGLDEDYNLLMKNKSMSLRMFSPMLKKNGHFLIRDRHLALFVALDMYYSAIINGYEPNIKSKKLNKTIKKDSIQ